MLAELPVAIMSIGRTSKKMSEFVGLSSFLLFLVLYAKGEEISGANNFFNAVEMLLQQELHVLIR